MKKFINRLLLIVAVLAVIVVLVWMNQDRLFGHMNIPDDSREFAEQIKAVRADQKWKPVRNYDRLMTREMLLESFRLGRDFMIANQKPEGNFNYEYDFVAKKQSPLDNQVRQAGALWGIALCHQFEPTDASREALKKGFDFFFRNSRPGPDDSLIVYYPGAKTVLTGTVALVALAIVDYLSAEPNLEETVRADLDRKLVGYLNFIRNQQFKSGGFSMGLVRGVNVRLGKSSPYFDGESMLALSKAAKYAGHPEYVPTIERGAKYLAKKYTVDAWRKEQDSDKTKGFYQWGSMSFWEYQDAGWKDADVYADTTLALAWWIVNTHGILRRTRNTGYSFEGLTHAYRIAEKRGDRAIASRLERTIDKGMNKLTSWQVEGPLVKRNKFLLKHRTEDPLAIGGIMNHRSEPGLRIDVTQHQMHAVILALRHLYKE